MGFTALIAQVVLARELLSLFLGNELTIALVLTMWLLIVAAGSAMAARAGRLAHRRNAFAWSQLATAVLLPMSLVVVRRIGPSGLASGEALSIGAVLAASLETLLPVSLPLGLQFVLAASAANRMRSNAPASLAYVYAAESVGAVLAGLAFHLYLAQHASAFGTFAIASLLNAASATWLFRGASATKPLWLASAATACAALALLRVSSRADLLTMRASPRWGGYTVVSHSPSRYGDLVSAVRAGQLSVFQSGVLVCSSESDESDEVAAHLPLLEHPNPKAVLLIGGALGGLPRKILEHPVARLDAVDLDPALQAQVARAARMAELAPAPVGDERFHLRFGDARLFVRSVAGRYDVILVNVPDPTTAALNRFYTLEFFSEARRALASGGVLAFSLTGSPHLLSGPVLLAAATADHTVQQVFLEVVVVPGDRMLFLTSNEPGGITRDPEVLAQRLRQRNVHSEFVNEAWLRDALLPFRAVSIESQLRQVARPRLNTDLDPISYYHQYRVWMDQVSPGLAGVAASLSRVRVWWAALATPVALIALAIARRRSATRKLGAVLAVAGIGGFGMVVEVIGLLVFQSALGYLYYALGALVAAFMAGLALGAAAIGRRQADWAGSARPLVAALVTAALVAAVLPAVFRAAMPVPALAAAAVGIIFVLVGSLVGAVFPIAAALYRGESGIAAAGGVIYAADLVGSAGGAFLAGAVAVPLLGVAGASHFTSLLLVAPLLVCLVSLRD
jgi:spermidine synthase